MPNAGTGLSGAGLPNISAGITAGTSLPDSAQSDTPADDATPSTLAQTAPVGREEVLRPLCAALDSVTRSSVLVITGDPGVGKTTVLDALVAYSRVRRVRAVHVRAIEHDSRRAHSLLRSIAEALHTLDLPDTAGVELSRLDTVLNARTPAEAAAPGGGPAAGEQSVESALTRLLRALCAQGPFLLALDDAHQADGESLAGLALAAQHLRDLPFMIVATVRSERWQAGSTFAATLGRLAGLDTGALLDLGDLDRAGTGELVAANLAARPSDDLVDLVHRQARGNPLYTHEVLLSLLDHRSIRVRDGFAFLVGTPNGAALAHRGALLLHRIFQQDGQARSLARVVSAFHRVGLDQVELLSELTGLAETDLQRAFDHLCDAAVLVPGEHGSFEFAHPLMAETLYRDLGPVERRRLHMRIGDYLRAHPSHHVDVLEMALHTVEAARPGDERAVRAALDAASATRNVAPLASAQWLGKALALVESDGRRAGEVLARQATAYWKAARPELAVQAGSQAVRLPVDDALRVATVVTVVNAANAMGRIGHAAELSAELMGDTPASAAVIAQRSLLYAHLGDPDWARELKDVAWAAVPDLSGEEQSVVFSYLALVENLMGTDRATRGALEHLWAIAEGRTRTRSDPEVSPANRLSALESWAFVSVWDESAVLGPDYLRLQRRLSEQVGWRDLGGQGTVVQAHRQMQAGTWGRALGTIRSGAVNLTFSGLLNNLVWLRTLEVEILLGYGLPREAAAVAESIEVPADAVYLQTHIEILLSHVEAFADPSAQLARKLSPVLDRILAARWYSLIGQAVDVLVDVCLLGPVDRATGTTLGPVAGLLEHLAGRAGMPARPTRAVAMARALLTGDPEPVAGHLSRLPGYRLHQGRLHLVAALVANAGGAVGTCAERDEHLRAAAEAFRALGASAWTRRVEQLARAWSVAGMCDSAPAVGAPTGPSAASGTVTGQRPTGLRPSAAPALTAVELRLVELVRAGLNNREIAEAMHYSRKTIEAYLSRLYRKTGASSRVDLVVAADREGWLEEPAP